MTSSLDQGVVISPTIIQANKTNNQNPTWIDNSAQQQTKSHQPIKTKPQHKCIGPLRKAHFMLFFLKKTKKGP